MSTPMGAGASSSSSAAAQPAAQNSMFPEGHLKVVGFFDQPDPEWYESVHAPDFLSFARPYLARYARNWVKDVRFGERLPFRVITEIQFASENAKEAVRALLATPAAGPLLEHTISQRAKLGIVDDTLAPGLGLFPVTPVPAQQHRGDSPASRQVLLFRRLDGTEQAAFESAARATAVEIGTLGSGINASLDLIGDSGLPALGDAVIYVGNAGDIDLPIISRPELVLTGILDVETRSSAVGAGLAG